MAGACSVVKLVASVVRGCAELLCCCCGQLRAYTLLSDMPKMDTSPSADIPGGTEATRADQRSAQLQRLGAYGDDSVEDEDVV